MKKIFSSLLASALLLSAFTAVAQISKVQSGIRPLVIAGKADTKENVASIWQAVPQGQAPAQSLMRSHPLNYLVYTLSEAALKPQMFALSQDPAEGMVITLPMPDGSYRDFKVWQTPMLPDELAAKYPDIKTFTGEAVGDRRITTKLDFTVAGFHAIVFESGNTSFIDPYDNLNDGYYMVHYKKDETRTMAQRMKCEVKGPEANPSSAGELMDLMQQQLPKLDLKKGSFDGGTTGSTGTAAKSAAKVANGWELRTYRLALSADTFYCKAATGTTLPTKAVALSAMTTTMNRVNGVYNREFSVQMNYCTHEDTLIYGCAGHTNGNDPFALIDAAAATCLTTNQTTCDTRIGTGNYDIGHVFTTGAGGLADVGIVCNASAKAQGVTGSSSPTGDGFDIDYVAHEMGHEFGSNHTFNNNADGSCSGNAVASCAYEPGSGATIMDYAGICNPDDIQAHSDPYFSARSIQEIDTALMFGGETTCAVTTATGNKLAFVAPYTAIYTIPYKTPFELIGPAAVDSVADTATTYSWYQWNLGDFGARFVNTYVHGPIFKSYQPVYTSTRIFPKLSMVLSGVLSNAGTEDAENEKAPDTTRILTFKMNVRTILNGNGCINQPDDTIHLSAVSTGSANGYAGFKVTSQNTAVTYAGSSTQTITWNVVGTSSAPVSASNVDIFMSTDGGQTWAYTIGTFPNTGSASVTIPNPAATSSTTRIKVKGNGNVFFNINSSNFTVTNTTTPVVGPINGTSFEICQSLSTGFTDTSAGGVWTSSVPSVGTIVPTTGVFTAIAPGTTTISYTTVVGTVTQVVTVDAGAVAGTITGSSTVCVGQTTPLTDATGTSGGTWSSSNPAKATVDPSSGVVTGVSAGPVTITYQATNSCFTVFTTFAMTVNALPVVAAITGTSFSACSGGTATLSDGTPLGAWSSTVPGVASVSIGGTVTAGTAGTATISYTVTNASGCVAAATAVFTSNAIPAATTSPSGAVVMCTGATLDIHASPSGAGYTYQWEESSLPLPGETNSTYTASAAGNYDVQVTSAAGCMGTSAVVNVTVSSSTIVVPAVSISASPGLVVCSSSSVPVTFTANPVNGGSTPTYVWFVGPTVAGTGNTYTYTPTDGDVISVTMTSSSPCASPTTATASVTMTVTPSVTPLVSIDLVPGDTVCIGSGITYSAVPTYGGAAPTYSWAVGGITVATGPSYSTTPADGDMVVCTMTSNYTPCLATATATSATLTVHVEALSVNSVSISASPATISAGEYITFAAIAPHGGSSPAYQWYVNAVAISGATNAAYATNTLVNGDIVTCRLTSSDPCALPHAVLSTGYSVMVTSGIWETSAAGGSFVLTPNPNKGAFTITGKLSTAGDSKVAIVINNVLGQTIYKTIAHAVNGGMSEHVDLGTALPAGMYFVNVISGGDNVVFHLVIDK